jgi:UDP-N-acetylglucosamine:LPS N-acetylglucosamine transferase
MVRVAAPFAGVKITRFVDDLQETIMACDLVVTRGSHVTTVEAAALGVPTIAITFAQNPMDDFLGSRIKNNHILNGRSLTAETLASYMQSIIGTKAIWPPLSTIDEETVAQEILRQMHHKTNRDTANDRQASSAQEARVSEFVRVG